MARSWALGNIGYFGLGVLQLLLVHKNRRWIAKFSAQGDDHDVELLEFCILELAAMCGIDVSPAKLEKMPRSHALLLLRFDRKDPVDKEHRIHYLSASALLDVPYESNGGSLLNSPKYLGASQ